MQNILLNLCVFRQNLAEMGDELVEEIMVEEYRNLRVLQEGLPRLQVLDELSKPLGLGEIALDDLDFSPLVEMRRRHQTRQAALGVRTRTSKSTAAEDSELTIKQQIIRRMREVLKEQDEHAVGTGYERSARWGVADGAGNSANAAAAAVTVAKQVCFHELANFHYFTDLSCIQQAAIRRNEIFKKANVPCLSEVKNARVTMLRPLRINDYGVVFTEHGLRVARGKYGTLLHLNGESQCLL